jgi:phosphoglycerate dehydrogenase-like enzyme
VTAERVVALVEDLPDEQLRVLRKALPPPARLADAPGDPGALERADYLIVLDGTVDAATLAAAPRLRAVLRLLGTGAVDEAACAERGVAVAEVQSPALISVAEHTVMVILMLLKRVQEASDRLRAGVVVDGMAPERTTQDAYAYNWVGLERFQALYGKRVGLVGLGKIGREAAVRLRPFGAELLYTKRNRLPEADEAALGARFVSLDELLGEADCVSLHARFQDGDDPMLGERELARMRPGSLLVNTARGRLVDEDALLAALERGQLGGAALDVFQYEPLPADSPLLAAPNLLLTPHTGGIPLAESRAVELEEAARWIAADAGR